MSSSQRRWTVDERKFFEPAEQTTLRRYVQRARRSSEKRGPWLDWCLVELAFQTGLRASELAALRCGDFHLKNERPGVLVQRGKGSKSRFVRINAYCCRVIERFLAWRRRAYLPIAAASAVFPVPGSDRPMTVRALQKRFARLLAATGITGHSLHHCRHTYATNLYLASGGNLRLVQKQLGHEKVTTTQVYADVFDDTMQVAIERLYQPRRKTRGI